jgi:hypothetical protein
MRQHLCGPLTLVWMRRTYETDLLLSSTQPFSNDGLTLLSGTQSRMVTWFLETSVLGPADLGLAPVRRILVATANVIVWQNTGADSRRRVPL